MHLSVPTSINAINTAEGKQRDCFIYFYILLNV